MDIGNIRKQLQDLEKKYQSGGSVRINNIRPEYKNDIQDAINYEKEYLNSPKFKERVNKQGYNVEDYSKRMQRRLSDIKINNTNLPGSYSAFNIPGQSDTAEIYIKNGDKKGLEDRISSIVSHELGHEYDNSNLESFINNRNPLVSKTKSGRFLQKLDYFNPMSSTQIDSHEADYDEVASDVHAARYELSKASKYDGRYSNFTNEAYNKMRELSNSSPQSASSSLFNKLMSPEMKKYNTIYEKLLLNGMEFEKLPKEDQDFVDEYEKNMKQHNDTQKKNIFDIMNRVVSNENTTENNPIYVKEGGKILREQLNNLQNKFKNGGKI